MATNHISSQLPDQIQLLEKQIESLRGDLFASKKAAKRFQVILNSHKEGYFEINLKGDFTYFSPSICKMSGYSEKELQGKNYRNYASAETAQRLFQAYNNIYLTGEPAEITEYNVIRKDGGILYWEVSAYLMCDSIGNPIGFQGFCRDVTDRKKIEIALKESEEKYRRILDNIEDGYYEVDLAGNYIFFNKSMCRILGYSSSELMGMNNQEYMDKENAEKVFQAFNQVFTTGEPSRSLDWVLIKKDRTRCHILNSVSLIRDANGTASGFRGIARDITHRKLAEIALLESEEKFRVIFEYAPDAYYLMSLNGEFIDGNKRSEDLTGHQRQELIGKNFVETGLLSTDDMTRAFEFLAKILQGMPADPEEFTLTRKNGTSVAVEIRAYPAKIKNQTIILGIARDITDRKQAEEALKESEERYRKLSIIDDLTQLYNSRHLYNQLKMEIDRVNRYNEPMSIILFDLDNFKAFNDAYGHIEGDQVLMRLGQVIKRCLRKTDSAYRYGGEEFIILLPMTICEDAVHTAERVKMEFKKENFSPVSDKTIHMTLSFGVGQYKPQEEMKVFVHRVDQLMYQAKKTGKDRVCYELND